VKNNEYYVTIPVRLFSSIQTLHNSMQYAVFMQYLVALQHRCCYGCVAMAWSNDHLSAMSLVWKAEIALP